MNNKNFLKKLDLEHLKRMMLIGLAELDKQTGSLYLSRVEKVENLRICRCPAVEEWENMDLIQIDIAIEALIDAKVPLNLSFEINDYKMILHDGDFEFDLSHILNMYLTVVFGEDYVNYFYEKRLKEIAKESSELLENSKKTIENFSFENKKKIYRKGNF